MTYSVPNNFIIYLAGPTASGKTSLAIQLGQYFGAEIFSADSRQVYREMNIGTAKPNPEQLESIPHHFVGHVSIHQQYSAGIYARELKSTLEAYFKRNTIAIIVGGTGLYFRSLMEGLADFPEIPESIQNKVSEGFQMGGLPWLQQQIRLLDPALDTGIDWQNPRRLVRALELILTIEKPLSHSRKDFHQEALPYPSVNIYIDVPRDELYRRINDRVDDMMLQGLFEEVTSLLPYRNCTALETVGYSELFDVLDGALNIDEAVDRIKRNTRRYAKRQMTWFRKYGDWQRCNADTTNSLITFIENSMLSVKD